jgi:hypothetical protein
MAEKELRIISTNFEIREDQEEEGKIVGYAALFDKPADERWGFVEKIAPGAFTKAILNSDTRALINHDPNLILGRKEAETLILKEDKKGLYYEIDPPDTTYANDLMESMRRGDINQSSFGFTVDKEEWDETGDVPTRTILEVGELHDVSPVTFPWYEDTESGVRSAEDVFNQYKQKNVSAEDIQTARQEELRKMVLEANKITGGIN